MMFMTIGGDAKFGHKDTLWISFAISSNYYLPTPIPLMAQKTVRRCKEVKIESAECKGHKL